MAVREVADRSGSDREEKKICKKIQNEARTLSIPPRWCLGIHGSLEHPLVSLTALQPAAC